MNANCHPLKPEVENITSTEGSHAPPASVTVIPALPSLLSATPLGLHRSTEQWSEGFRSVPLLFSGVQDLTCPLPASSSTGCPQQLGVRITNQAPSTTPGKQQLLTQHWLLLFGNDNAEGKSEHNNEAGVCSWKLKTKHRDSDYLNSSICN